MRVPALPGQGDHAAQGPQPWVRARMRVRVRMKVRACLKALGEEDSFGEVASPSAGTSKQRQKNTRRPGKKLR